MLLCHDNIVGMQETEMFKSVCVCVCARVEQINVRGFRFGYYVQQSHTDKDGFDPKCLYAYLYSLYIKYW